MFSVVIRFCIRQPNVRRKSCWKNQNTKIKLLGKDYCQHFLREKKESKLAGLKINLSTGHRNTKFLSIIIYRLVVC